MGLGLVRLGAAQTPRVSVDQRVELLAIVFNLAGSAEGTQGRLTGYNADIQRHFGLFRNHPAITSARTVRDAQGLSGDALMSLAINISPPPMILERQPFDAPAGESRWRTGASSRLLAEMRRFVSEARVMQFLTLHQTLYDTAAARLRRVLERNADFSWYGKFFGVAPEQTVTVIPLLANSGGTFAPVADIPGHRTERFVIVGHDQADSLGLPTWGDGVVEGVVHEYTHAFVNPLVEGAMERPATAVYAATADAMREQGYGGWVSLSFETLARAAVARYYTARVAVGRDSAQARAYLADQKARGWVWVEPLGDLLATYEADRDTYPTLKAFMPRVVQFFDSLPARLPAMQQRYDATRPTVAGASIANGATDVDPALKDIAITFSRPMRTASFGVTAIPGARERAIRITQQAFDSTGTVLHIGVTLEPSHDYEFTLNRYTGGGFVSVDGVPLARYRVQFKTRPRS
jgi:hypothetical protein